MGFLDECRQSTRPKPTPVIDTLLAEWPKKDRDEFVAALKDTSISTGAIQKVLARRNITVSYNAIAKYRRERI